MYLFIFQTNCESRREIKGVLMCYSPTHVLGLEIKKPYIVYVLYGKDLRDFRAFTHRLTVRLCCLENDLKCRLRLEQLTTTVAALMSNENRRYECFVRTFQF